MRAVWRGVFRRHAAAAEVEAELLFHLEAHAADLEAQGVPAAEARRRARAELGMMLANGAEVHRGVTGMRLLDETVGDVRYGLRGLWRSKGFAATAILSLAIGIGAATAMFSVVYAVLLDVYPYADADRTVNPIVHDPGVPDDWNWFVLNPAQLAQYKAVPCFEDVFAQGGFGIQMEDNDVTQPLHITLLSGNAQSFNRVPALLGRTLQSSDGDLGGKPTNVAVLGYKFWRTHYGGDRGVVGREIKAGSNVFRIVGVMPERFTMGGAPDLYMPLSQFPVRANSHYIAFAKLKPGVTAAQASAMVDPLVHQFAHDEPNYYPKNFHVRLQPLIEGFTARSKLLKNFPLLYLAVGALLLIGCANCSLLLLARGTTRVHEFALRAAVGAGRARMVRQLLVECLTISVLGSVLGTALAYGLARLPLILADDLFPTEAVIRVNGWVLLFAIGTAMVAGVFFGLLPALKFSRPEIAGMLNAGGRRTVAAGSRRPLQALIAAQIALTLVLLTVSGAAVGGFARLLRMPLGYDPANAMGLYVGFAKGVAPTWAERVALQAAMQHAVENVPGVTAAAIADEFPPSGGGNLSQFEMVGGDGVKRNIRVTLMGPGYFSAMRISLKQGRMFTDGEWQQGLPLVVVNEAFVRRFSPDRSVLDRAVKVAMLDAIPEGPPAPGEDTGPARTLSPAITGGEVRVIGVSADALNDGLDKPVAPEIYGATTLAMYGYTPLMVRTAGDPHGYAPAVGHALHGLGAKNFVQIVPLSFQEMVEHENAWRTQRLVAVLLSIFAVGALLLSLVGLYSVVAYVAAQRRPEFGIRMALGAPRQGIALLVLRSNALVIVGGAVVGVLLSLLVRARFAQWSEGSSRGVLPVVVAAGVLVAAAVGASLVPAYRASRVEPSEALRAE